MLRCSLRPVFQYHFVRHVATLQIKLSQVELVHFGYKFERFRKGSIKSLILILLHRRNTTICEFGGIHAKIKVKIKKK